MLTAQKQTHEVLTKRICSTQNAECVEESPRGFEETEFEDMFVFVRKRHKLSAEIS